MARKFSKAFLVALAIATLLESSTAQSTVHVVGDALSWVVPPGGATAYTTWAANKTFNVGDILVFNFATGRHDVAEVTKAAFDACNTASPISRVTTSPANVTLNSAGEHYYICTFTGHCAAGQKLAVNVTSGPSSPAPQPSTPSPVPTPTATPTPTPTPTSSPTPTPTPTSSPTPTPTSAPTPAPTRSPVTYIVGDALGWTVPPNGSVAYQLWASGKTFMVGDTLVFNYINGTHDVAEVTKEAYGSCDTNSTISLETNPPTRITLTTSGEHHYICTFPRHCSLGQQLAINVTGSNTASPVPSPSATPPPSTATPSSPSPTGASTPPSPGNSAKSLGVALSSTFLAIFVGFLY
ncbi:hypothetical protein ACOSP7_015579 [Xanthoceras sorbifolium]